MVPELKEGAVAKEVLVVLAAAAEVVVVEVEVVEQHH